MAVTARKEHRGSLTYRDLWSVPEDGNRYEIIEGEMSVTPPPSVTHQRVSGNLGRILMNHVVDPRKQTLQAVRLDEGTYTREAERTGNAIFRPSLFPGLASRLADVWA
jgi:Uma2 family endonuclease